MFYFISQYIPINYFQNLLLLFQIYGIPEQTLRDRIQGKVSVNTFGAGGVTIFHEFEEKDMVDHICYNARIGYPLMRADVIDLANDYASELGKKLEHAIGRGWFRGFLKRWPMLGMITPRNLDMYRAQATSTEAIKVYYDSLEEIFDKYKFSRRPRAIYNIDETGCQASQKPSKIVGPRGVAVQCVTTPRSPNSTLIACASATGQVIPPYIVLPGSRVNKEDRVGATPGTSVTCTKNGWSNRDVFEKYMKEHFALHIPNFGQEWILVVYDGHTTHTGIGLINWAKEHKVILFLLPPHSSWKTQPLDVGVFHPFKHIFRAECHRFMRRNSGKTISRSNMVKLICSAHAKAFTPSNIMASFKKTGVYPFNREAITPDELSPAGYLRSVGETQVNCDTHNTFFSSRIPEPNKNPNSKRRQSRCGPLTEEAPAKIYKATPLDGLKLRIALCSKSPVSPAAPPCPVTQQHYDQQVHSPVQCNPVHPSTSRGIVEASPDFVEEFYSSDTDGDDDVCCFYEHRTPDEIRQAMRAGRLVIVDWIQCTNHSCCHWVHKSCCTSPPQDKYFLCHHCTTK